MVVRFRTRLEAQKYLCTKGPYDVFLLVYRVHKDEDAFKATSHNGRPNERLLFKFIFLTKREGR